MFIEIMHLRIFHTCVILSVKAILTTIQLVFNPHFDEAGE